MNEHTQQAETESLRDEIAKLHTENATLRDQMLQANLYELMQRRKNDALQDEIERLQARLTQPTDGDSESESHD